MKNIILIGCDLLPGPGGRARAAAVSLSLSPASQTISVGDTAWVDLRGRVGWKCTSPSLGGFDVDIAYDSLILTITPPPCCSAIASEIHVEAMPRPSAGETSGVVNVYAVSFLAADKLD